MGAIAAAACAGRGGSILDFANYMGKQDVRESLHDAISVLRGRLPAGMEARAELAASSISLSSVFDGSCYKPDLSVEKNYKKSVINLPKELCLLEERLG